jgi:hypothetical protein
MLLLLQRLPLGHAACAAATVTKLLAADFGDLRPLMLADAAFCMPVGIQSQPPVICHSCLVSCPSLYAAFAC